MKIIQNNKDGSAEMIFSEAEIKILNEKKKLFFEPKEMKSFVNHLVHIATQFNMILKDHKDQISHEGDEIKSK